MPNYKVDMILRGIEIEANTSREAMTKASERLPLEFGNNVADLKATEIAATPQKLDEAKNKSV